MRRSYFYVAPMGMGTGSIIEPGNWGRIIRALYRVGQQDHDFRLHRETAYEFGRRLWRPEAPSRLECLFACPDFDAAVEYKSANHMAGVVHEVVPLLESTLTYETSWSLFGSPADTDLRGLEQIIEAYWSGGEPRCREVLIGGAVTVLQRF